MRIPESAAALRGDDLKKLIWKKSDNGFVGVEDGVLATVYEGPSSLHITVAIDDACELSERTRAHVQHLINQACGHLILLKKSKRQT